MYFTYFAEDPMQGMDMSSHTATTQAKEHVGTSLGNNMQHPEFRNTASYCFSYWDFTGRILAVKALYFMEVSDKEERLRIMVTIYSATWCAFCHTAKEYLDKLGITYEDKDIEKDSKNAEESIAKSNQMGIPVIDIDGTIIVGFDKPRIDAALLAHVQK